MPEIVLSLSNEDYEKFNKVAAALNEPIDEFLITSAKQGFLVMCRELGIL